MGRNMKRMVLFLAGLLVLAGSASAEVVRGKVTMVDLKANRISVEIESKERSFTFDPQDFIVWKGDDEVKVEEIKTGSDAEVGYYKDETGIEIASWVDLTPVEEGAEQIATPEETTLPAEMPGQIAPAPAMATGSAEHPGKTMEHPGKTMEQPGEEAPETE